MVRIIPSDGLICKGLQKTLMINELLGSRKKRPVLFERGPGSCNPLYKFISQEI